MNETRIVAETVAQLRRCLAEVPFCAVDSSEPELPEPSTLPSEPDWIGRLRLGDDEWVVVLEAKQSGQPRLAREAANAIPRWTSRYPNAIGVFAAPYVSPAAADILGARTSDTSIFQVIAVSVLTASTFESKDVPTSLPNSGICGRSILPRQNESYGPCFLPPSEAGKLQNWRRRPVSASAKHPT